MNRFFFVLVYCIGREKKPRWNRNVFSMQNSFCIKWKPKAVLGTFLFKRKIHWRHIYQVNRHQFVMLSLSSFNLVSQDLLCWVNLWIANHKQVSQWEIFSCAWPGFQALKWCLFSLELHNFRIIALVSLSVIFPFKLALEVARSWEDMVHGHLRVRCSSGYIWYRFGTDRIPPTLSTCSHPWTYGLDACRRRPRLSAAGTLTRIYFPVGPFRMTVVVHVNRNQSGKKAFERHSIFTNSFILMGSVHRRWLRGVSMSLRLMNPMKNRFSLFPFSPIFHALVARIL